MELVIPDLYASAAAPLPFAPSLAMRSFLLRREHGNLLIYGADVDGEATAIAQLGGVWRRYLNHRHEADFASATPASPPFVHERDGDAVATTVDVGGTFSSRHFVADDFEAIPIPGHTPGASAYLWNGPGGRVLFTGDTIYLSEGEWVAAVLESSDRATYAASLELIRDLEFDVLIPWIATRDGPFHAPTDSADARRRIDAIIARIQRGETR